MSSRLQQRRYNPSRSGRRRGLRAKRRASGLSGGRGFEGAVLSLRPAEDGGLGGRGAQGSHRKGFRRVCEIKSRDQLPHLRPVTSPLTARLRSDHQPGQGPRGRVTPNRAAQERRPSRARRQSRGHRSRGRRAHSQTRPRFL